MFELLEKFNQTQIDLLSKDKEIEDFRPGDQVAVSIKIFENGKFERTQIFRGLCIAKNNRGLHSSCIVRRIGSQKGEGIEYVFPIYSPAIAGIKNIQKGRVRRAKLYYMRNLYGKAAKIKTSTNIGNIKK